MRYTFRQEHVACAACGWSGHVFAWTHETPTCSHCLCPAARVADVVHNQAPGVFADSIPGGIMIRHGICNEDGSPRRYDSKTEIRAEAQRRGLTILGETPGARESRWV